MEMTNARRGMFFPRTKNLKATQSVVYGPYTVVGQESIKIHTRVIQVLIINTNLKFVLYV